MVTAIGKIHCRVWNRMFILIGNSVLIVCTAEHRIQLVKALERLEVDV